MTVLLLLLLVYSLGLFGGGDAFSTERTTTPRRTVNGRIFWNNSRGKSISPHCNTEIISTLLCNRNGSSGDGDDKTKNNSFARIKHACQTIGTKIVFPPIPEQENKSVSWKDSFTNPKFIAKEFWIGAKYMSQQYFLLMVASTIAHRYWSFPATARLIAEQPNAMMDAMQFIVEKSGPGLICDTTINGWLSKTQIKTRPVISPLLKAASEEVCYRGIDQSMQYIEAWIGLWGFALFAGKKWWIGVPWILANAMDIPSSLLRVFQTPNNQFLALTGTITILSAFITIQKISMETRLLIEARRNQIKSKALPPSKRYKRIGLGLGVDEKNRNRIVENACPYRTESTAKEQEIANYVTGSLLLYSRLQASLSFGLGHLDDPLALHNQYLKLQKCIGTFVSSFLIESRLLMKRKTLWCPIGAHMFFNTMGILRGALCKSEADVFRMYILYGFLFVRPWWRSLLGSLEDFLSSSDDESN